MSSSLQRSRRCRVAWSSGANRSAVWKSRCCRAIVASGKFRLAEAGICVRVRGRIVEDPTKHLGGPGRRPRQQEQPPQACLCLQIAQEPVPESGATRRSSSSLELRCASRSISSNRHAEPVSGRVLVPVAIDRAVIVRDRFRESALFHQNAAHDQTGETVGGVALQQFRQGRFGVSRVLPAASCACASVRR